MRSRMRKQRLQAEGLQERAEAELRECTFQPAIRRVPFRDSNAIPDQLALQHSASPCPSISDASFAEGLGDDLSRQPPTATTAILNMLDDWRSTRQAAAPAERQPQVQP